MHGLYRENCSNFPILQTFLNFANKKGIGYKKQKKKTSQKWAQAYPSYFHGHCKTNICVEVEMNFNNLEFLHHFPIISRCIQSNIKNNLNLTSFHNSGVQFPPPQILKIKFASGDSA